MKNSLLFIVLSILGLSLNAQTNLNSDMSVNENVNSTIDSIYRIYKTGKDPDNRLIAALTLARMNFQNEPEKTLHITESAINLLDSLGNSGVIPDSSWLNFKISFLHYRTIAFGNLGDIDAQIDAAMERLRFVQQNGLKGMETNALNEIGNIYIKLGHHDEARDYFERALKIEEAQGRDPLYMGLAIGNLVNTFGFNQLNTNLKY